MERLKRISKWVRAKSRMLVILIIGFLIGTGFGTLLGGFITFRVLLTYGPEIGGAAMDVGVRLASITHTDGLRWEVFNGGTAALADESATPLATKEPTAEPVRIATAKHVVKVRR